MKRILIVEDDDSLNRGISLKLTKEGYAVVSAETIQEAEVCILNGGFDLIICDIGLPDGSGLSFGRRIRRESQVLLLFLTAMDSEMDIVNGYDAGADDYVTKPFSLMVLLSKVNALMKRAVQAEVKPKLGGIQSGEIRILLAERRAWKGEEPLLLSPNEWKLLHFFMEHPGHILSKNQLMECLWEQDGEFLDGNTTAVNIRRLREKVEKDPSEPAYIKNIRGMGYLWEKRCSPI